jgi:hypothetical protein
MSISFLWSSSIAVTPTLITFVHTMKAILSFTSPAHRLRLSLLLLILLRA